MNISQDGLRYIGPMAVRFIVVATYHIGRKVVTDKIIILLLLLGGITTYFIRQHWIYPLVLILGGLITVAGVILMQKSGFALDNIMVMLLTIALLLTKKVPAPLIVLLVMVAGFLI